MVTIQSCRGLTAVCSRVAGSILGHCEVNALGLYPVGEKRRGVREREREREGERGSA